MKAFVRRSIKLGVNKIDWIRTIYFSLFGSSMLSFAMKFNLLEFIPALFFGLGTAFFLVGLLSSMRISDAFKVYEIEFRTLGSESKEKFKRIDDYILEKEATSHRNLQHFMIYTSFFIALGCIGLSSFFSDKAISEKNISLEKSLEDTGKKINQNAQIINKQLNSNDLLIHDLIEKNEQLMDSLNSVSKIIREKSKKRNCNLLHK